MRIRFAMSELRHALRRLRRSPGFAVLAVLTLGLGVGAATSTFALLHATVFRDLPFPDPDRLVALYLTRDAPGEEARQLRWSHPEFESLRASASDFEALAAFGAEGFNLSGGDVGSRVSGEVVSAEYFRVLGIEATMGRTFRAEEGLPGARPVAVVSHRLWRSHLGEDGEAIGRSVRVNGSPLTVVGVMPEGFQGLTGPADLWITHAVAAQVTYPDQLTTHQHFLNVVGRLHSDATAAGARADLARMTPVLAERFGSEHETDARWSAALEPLDSARTDPAVERERLILFGAVLLLLLIAGANLGGLLLGRSLSRRRELAIRRALGSSRGRLVGQLLAESLVLGLAGGLVGVLLAVWLTGAAASLLPPGFTGSGYGRLSQFTDISVDGWVLLFGFGAALASAVGFGVAPALAATREASEEGLSPASRHGSGGPGGLERGFSTLVVGQFALALTLLMGAGLLLQTLTNLRARDAGHDAEHVVTFRISPPTTHYGPGEGSELLTAILERVSAVPGIRAASVTPCTPFMSCPTRLVRRPSGEGAGDEWITARRHYVAPGHLRTLGIDLDRGRDIAASDGPEGPNVVVVNRTMARRLWPGEDPVGRQLLFQGADLNFVNGDSAATVVGVADDVLYGDATELEDLDVYTPYRQFAWPSTYIVARTDGVRADAVVPALRRAVGEADPNIPIHDVRSLEERKSEALAAPRFNGLLLAGFAGLALLLAALGIYGTMSQHVGRRAREMAVRQALGARPAGLLGLVVRRGMRLAAWGIAAGTAGAFLGARVLASQLYGVPAADPRIFLVAVACLVAAGILALSLPARRAARVDPMLTLREE